jgi:hypothetical protein
MKLEEIKVLKYLQILLTALYMIVSFTGCSKKQGPTDSPGTVQDVTDYSQTKHWLNIPASIDKEVDIFYLYPTSWQKVDSTESNFCKIDNPLMLKYSKFAFERQASAFETVGNIYAPYYRQDDALYTLSLPLEEQAKVVGGIPKTDVFAAFDYYIKHYNNGRPYILVGHSQGSNVMVFLLSEYMKENPQVYSRMIAAYVVGYSITGEYLANNPHLKFANGPDDTGVIISFNTEAPEVVKGTNGVVLPGAIAINPITWTRDETLAPASENLGSITLNKDGSVAEGIPTPIMNYADAQVDKDKGVVICTTVSVDKLAPGSALFARGIFHSFDYAFYYYNIRENAANRTKKYLNK